MSFIPSSNKPDISAVTGGVLMSCAPCISHPIYAYAGRLRAHRNGADAVICTATLDDRVPPFRVIPDRVGSLPSTQCCRARRRTNGAGKPGAAGLGRTHEIQRLIGRSLSAVG